VYNVACGGRTTLNELFRLIKAALSAHDMRISAIDPVHGPSRPGDVRHSQADIAKARTLLGYAPGFDVRRGMDETVRWYCERRP
jgi:UDP-N-acetylglucosamine 4-epimerase